MADNNIIAIHVSLGHQHLLDVTNPVVSSKIEDGITHPIRGP